MWGEFPSGAAYGRVLVADDDPANVALLERVLKSGGHRDVHATCDPGELASVLQSVDPDLLLLDWHMPPTSGADVLMALRADDRWSALPVIVVTGDPQARLRALEVGATDFLTKPFDHAEILLRVRNVLRVRLLHQRLQAHNDELEEHVRERTAELASVNERLRQAEIVRRDFVAMASHEMRTPLTVVRGFADLWATRGLPSSASAADQLDAMRRNARRLEHLVHNLLLASRVETGGEGHRRRTFLVRDVLDAAVLSSLAAGDITVEDNTQGRFAGDPDLLALVVANLVTNAERYGAPPIELRATAVPDGLEVTVTDHGPGVPAEFVPKLFERFSQATVGDRRTAQGAGLGLWVSRYIVQAHRGKLWYECAPRGGARFTMRLPQGQGEAIGSGVR